MSAQKIRPAGALAALVGLVGFSAVAGLLVTVMVAPALAVTSSAARTSIDIFDDLPENLPIGATPQQNTIWAIDATNKDGSPHYKQIATVYSQDRQEINWEDVTPVLKDAVLAAEDRRFYSHGGVDLQGIARAVVKNSATGSGQGGSTLTQQLVKNICVTKAVTDHPEPTKADAKAQAADIKICQAHTLERKIKEMKQAIGLEKTLSKNEILLGYLNIAGFGGNVYGIESAAERYYSTTVKDLTIAQAASLVGIVNFPSDDRLDIEANWPSNKLRRDVIIRNMAAYGYISKADEATALATPVDASTVHIAPAKNGCIAADQYAKQFCDYVVRSVKDMDPLGTTEQERIANWKIGGYTVKTSLDLRLNKVAQTTLRKYAPIKEKALQLGASAVSIEPGTGYIRTMAQNKVFDNQSKANGGGRAGTTAINFNTDSQYGGSSGFQPGSGYKVFTLINWLEQGHGLNEVVNVTPVATPLSDFTDTCNGPYGGGTYKPTNDSGETGYKTVRQATAQSINGGYVQMALQLDLCQTKKIALSLGMHMAAPIAAYTDRYGIEHPKREVTDLSTVPSSILGVDSIAPMTLAASYAAVAANGTYCKPIAVVDITDSKGKDLGGQAKDCTPAAIPTDIAAAAADGLSTGPATIYPSNPKDGTTFIGKTGTTNKSQQTWVTMSSTALTTTVWFGNITGSYPIRNYCGGAAGCDGGQQRHDIMRAILVKADKLYKGGAFPTADSRLITGVNVKVADYTGMDEATAKATIEASQLTYEAKGDIASPLPEGQVAKQLPAAGQPLSKGQKVQIWLSDGTKSIVPDVTTTPMDAGTATGAINAAGFSNVPQVCVATPVRDGSTDPATGQPTNPQLPADGQVVQVSPAAGSTRLKSKPVTISVAHATC
ncbi:transglycosylase domain-containing protein [soil metagenome]